MPTSTVNNHPLYESDNGSEDLDMDFSSDVQNSGCAIDSTTSQKWHEAAFILSIR